MTFLQIRANLQVRKNNSQNSPGALISGAFFIYIENFTLDEKYR